MSKDRISRYLKCAGYELHVSEWGAGNTETVVCWHGLARSGRDFDALARHLSGRYRVLCPDTIGRGLSQWAKDRDKEYCFAVYCATAMALLDQLDIDDVHWIGTSMGGLIGMHLAAGPLQGRMDRLLINDIGPVVQQLAAERIAAYVASPPVFDTYSGFEDYIRTVYVPFGQRSNATWRLLAETTCRRTADGKFTVHYDPKIGTQFTTHAADLDGWPAYDSVLCRTLVLRGADSDVLSTETAEEMTRRGPKCDLITVPGCGHAPVFDTPKEQKIVDDFLAG